MNRFLRYYISALLLTGFVNQAQADEAHLAPHKALYDISLTSMRSGSQISDIWGEMFFELSEDCATWTTDHRFKMVYDYTDAPPVDVDSDFQTIENKDGQELVFNSRRQRDGEVYEEISGRAAMLPDGTIRANYFEPEGIGFALPASASFPMGHVRALVEEAQNNAKFYNTILFDGSDTEGPVEVNAFIGQPINVMAEMFYDEDTSDADLLKDLDGDLLNSRAWPMRLAYFPLSSTEEAADYEMEITFHENGVISDMVIEYTDFTIHQKLTALEKVDADLSACD